MDALEPHVGLMELARPLGGVNTRALAPTVGVGPPVPPQAIPARPILATLMQTAPIPVLGPTLALAIQGIMTMGPRARVR